MRIDGAIVHARRERRRHSQVAARSCSRAPPTTLRNTSSVENESPVVVEHGEQDASRRASNPVVTRCGVPLAGLRRQPALRRGRAASFDRP